MYGISDICAYILLLDVIRKTKIYLCIPRALYSLFAMFFFIVSCCGTRPFISWNIDILNLSVVSVRGLKKVSLYKYEAVGATPTAVSDLDVQSRVITFSDDGTLFAYCDGKQLVKKISPHLAILF